MDEARLFIPTDDFDFNPTGSKNPVKQEIAISGFPRCACGNRAQTVNIETLGHMLKTQKSFLGLLDGFFLKIPVTKNILTKAHRQANVLDCVHPPDFIHFANYHTHGI
jgi:hypothetical protein